MASETATAQELERELEQEHRLVEEAQHGNLDAMRPILERYAAPLYGTVILPRLGDAASAEEVLRDTLATAVEKIRRFTWQGKSIYPWLRQIAINKVYDVHRQSKRSRRLADAMVHEIAVESDPASHADAQLIATRVLTAVVQLGERRGVISSQYSVGSVVLHVPHNAIGRIAIGRDSRSCTRKLNCDTAARHSGGRKFSIGLQLIGL